MLFKSNGVCSLIVNIAQLFFASSFDNAFKDLFCVLMRFFFNVGFLVLLESMVAARYSVHLSSRLEADRTSHRCFDFFFTISSGVPTSKKKRFSRYLRRGETTK